STADTRLLGFFVVEDSAAPPASSELRKFLRQRVPEYMIPSHLEAVDRIPLTPNGKLDRARLASSAIEATDQPAFEPLVTDAERLVADVWRELLGTAKIGAQDNFFDLGGHSLLSIQCVAKLRDATGVRLSPRVLLLESLRDVATALSEGEVVASPSSVIEAPNGRGEEYAPTAPASRALGWLRKRLGGRTP
ncbi:MAG: phosphopantetheine-binding protein, partial [Myxococcota bacterium]